MSWLNFDQVVTEAEAAYKIKQLIEVANSIKTQAKEFEAQVNKLEAELNQSKLDRVALLMAEEVESLSQQMEKEMQDRIAKYICAYDKKCKELDSAKAHIRLLREEIKEMRGEQ